MNKLPRQLFLIIYILVSVLCTTNIISANSGQVLPTAARIDAELLPAFLTSPSMDFEKVGIQSWRTAFAKLVNSPALPSDPAVKVYNVTIANHTNDANIRLRIYQPVDKQSNMPGIYWIHGGGFLFGVPEQDEAQSIRLAKEVGAVVVSVDYRLAPEHPYPAALLDSYDGLAWFAEHAAALGVDKERMAIAGASAGGNLCAALALLARDRGGPNLVLQMPLYPMLDDRLQTPAAQEDIDMRVWNNTSNRYAWRAYLGELAGSESVSQYMAPARATDLAGLPPMYTCVGNLDPFRDDTINYAARMAQAGIAVELHMYPDAYHAFEVMAPTATLSQQAVAEYIRVLNRALKK